MGKGSSRPTDVVGAAEVEGEYAKDAVTAQTYANRPNQSNAFGNVSWTQSSQIDPATGEPVTTWNQTESLSPEMQGIFDTQITSAGNRASLAGDLDSRIAEEMGTPVDWGSYGEMVEGPQSSGLVGGTVAPTTAGGDFTWSSDNRVRAEDDSYARSVRRMDPRFERERQALELRLRNRGLASGDQQYQSEMELYNTGKNDAYEMARMGATAEGRLEDNQSFGQASSAWDTNIATQQQRFAQSVTAAQNARAADAQAFEQKERAAATANALRDKKIAEDLAKRNFSLNEQERLGPDVRGLTETFSSGG